MQPLVSVVIPFFNAQSTLRDCVYSVLNQDYTNLEIVLVDDCSSDASSSFAKSICSGADNVYYLRPPRNVGVSQARNLGASCSNGEFLTFLDSDDIYVSASKVSSSISLLLTFQLSKRTCRIVVYSNILLSNSAATSFIRVKPLFSFLPGNLWVFATMLPRDFILPRFLFDEIGGFPPDLCLYEDWIFRMRLSSEAQFLNTHSYASVYRLSDSGLSKKLRNTSTFLRMIKILKYESALRFGTLSYLLSPLFLIALFLYHAYVKLLVRALHSDHHWLTSLFLGQACARDPSLLL